MSDNRFKALEDIRAKMQYLEAVIQKLTSSGLITISRPIYAVFDRSDVQGQKEALFAYAALKHKCEKQDLTSTSSRYEPNTISCKACGWHASTRAESYFEMNSRKRQDEVANGNYPEFETMIVPMKHIKSVFPRGAFRQPHVYDTPDRYYYHNHLQCLVCGGCEDKNGPSHENCVYSYMGGMVAGQMIVGPGVPLPIPLPERRPATEGEVRFFMSELNRLREISARIDAELRYENSPTGQQMIRERNRRFTKLVEDVAYEASVNAEHKRDLFQAYLNHCNDDITFEEWKKRN